MALLIGAVALGFMVAPAPAGEWCSTGRITGYVRGHHSSHTYDGTSVWTREPIAAAGHAVPMGSIVSVEGIGEFRVADRGMLGPTDVDILVDSVGEAYALTSTRVVCVRPPEG